MSQSPQQLPNQPLKPSTKRIKITMLADSTAGKTCYILGMYCGMWMQNHGFSIASVDDNDDKELNNNWAKLITATSNNRFPAPTNQNKIYQFRFLLGYNQISEFEWIDYRGDVLQDNPNGQDVQALNQYLQGSSCLFLCLSGEHFQNPITTGNQARIMYETKALYMNQYLSNVRRSKEGLFPVIITLSKYDYCYQRKEELIEEIKLIFPGLFQPNSNWIVLICPVTLSFDLAQDPNTTAITAYNCHYPLIFALYCSLREQIIESRNSIERIEEQLEELESNFFKQLINRANIKRLEKQLEDEERKINNNCQYIQQLAEYLNQAHESNADIYVNGQREFINVDNLC